MTTEELQRAAAILRHEGETGDAAHFGQCKGCGFWLAWLGGIAEALPARMTYHHCEHVTTSAAPPLTGRVGIVEHCGWLTLEDTP